MKLSAAALIGAFAALATAATAASVSPQCQERLDAYCNEKGVCDITDRHCDTPFVALNDYDEDKKSRAWRCYSPSTLNKNHTAYEKGSCYCTRDAQLAEVAHHCNTQESTPFTGGEEGYNCYRIPAITRLPDGSLLVFAEGRKFTCADHDWNDIVMKRSRDNGRTWSKLSVVYSESTPKDHITIGNPAPVFLADSNTTLLPFCRNNLQIYLTRSSNGGASWSKPQNITDQVSEPTWSFYATGPPGSYVSQTGRILVPSDHKNTSGFYAHVAYSDDKGKTWTRSNSIFNGNECQVTRAPNGSLILNSRTGDSNRQVSFSNDDGTTWFAPVPIVNETACEASTLTLENFPGGPLLVMSSAFASSRSNMTIHTSRDGLDWTPAVSVYPGPAAYSALVTLNATAVGLLYERDGYEAISYRAIDLAAPQAALDRAS